MTVVNELMCEICGKIFSEPLSLPCGHSFCGGTCISSSEDSKHEVECPLCKHVTNISELTANEQLAEKVFQFKLQNPTILCTSCSSCSGACEECYLCFHCENYLCRDCIIMHREMYSSVLLSRFLTLRVRQNRLSKLLNSDRISQIDAFANTIATLQAAIETALSRAEICLDSIEELVTEKPFHDLPESPDLSLVVQSLEAEGAAAEQKDRIQNASKLIPDLPSKPWPASLIHRIHNIPPKAPLILPAATGKHPPQSDAPEPANERPAHAVAKSTCITFQVIGKASKTGHLQTGDLEKHFSQFGKIVKLHRYLNADNTPSTCGFVVFEKLAEAQAALSEKCHVLDKHHLKLASSRRVPSVSQ